MADFHIETEHLAFSSTPEGYRVRCRACGVELFRGTPKESFEDSGEDGVIDHLYRHHRITETQMRDDVQRRIDRAERDGELPPDTSFN